MRERIQYYFREIRGFKYDEVNAVMAVGRHDPRTTLKAPDVLSREFVRRQTSSRSPPASSESTTS